MKEITTIHYKTKRGSHINKTIPDHESRCKEMERLFKSKTEAKATRNGVRVGSVWKDSGKWNWYLEDDSE